MGLLEWFRPKRQRARDYLNTALALSAQGDHAAALDSYDKAVAMLKGFARDDPQAAAELAPVASDVVARLEGAYHREGRDAGHSAPAVPPEPAQRRSRHLPAGGPFDPEGPVTVYSRELPGLGRIQFAVGLLDPALLALLEEALARHREVASGHLLVHVSDGGSRSIVVVGFGPETSTSFSGQQSRLSEPLRQPRSVAGQETLAEAVRNRILHEIAEDIRGSAPYVEVVGPGHELYETAQILGQTVFPAEHEAI